MIYFIQNGQDKHIKIGFTQQQPKKRLKELQTGSPHKLKMLRVVEGGRLKESELHERFAHLRVNGEWFRPDPELLDYIKSEGKSKKPFEKSCGYPLTVKGLKTILSSVPDNTEIYLDVDYANTDGFSIIGIVYGGGDCIEFVTDAVLR